MLSGNQVDNPFGGKVRVRASGILIENEKILLLRHENLGSAGYLWLPPGGGVEFGDSLYDTLKKEFQEETNLTIEIGQFLFVNEFIKQPYHAIELFFEVKRVSGTLELGFDPELSADEQMLSDAKFFSRSEIDDLDSETIHNMFDSAGARDKITDLRGLFTFKH